MSPRVIVGSILATDSSAYFELLAETGVQLDLHGVLSSAEERKEKYGTEPKMRLLMAKVFLHTADISGPTRDFKQAERMAMSVAEEFFFQGAQEKALQLRVSPFMDKDNPQVPKYQLNLIEFIVAPLVATVGQLFPELGRLKDNLATNSASWALRWQEENSMSEPGWDGGGVEGAQKQVENIHRILGVEGVMAESGITSRY